MGLLAQPAGYLLSEKLQDGAVLYFSLEGSQKNKVLVSQTSRMDLYGVVHLMHPPLPIAWPAGNLMTALTSFPCVFFCTATVQIQDKVILCVITFGVCDFMQEAAWVVTTTS
jgi:hypothetical protein